MEADAQIAYLDTHLVLWLYDGRLDLIPESVQNLIERNGLLISPIVELELQYLFEAKKITQDGKTYSSDLQRRIGLKICEEPFSNVISSSLKEPWTRDPFDRIITAQARLKNALLITKDRSILKNYSKACWLVVR